MPRERHGACDYAGKTGYQYENKASRDNHALLDKILRISADETIPPTTPTWVNATARVAAPWAPPPQAKVPPTEFRVGGAYPANGAATDQDGDEPVMLSWEAV